MASRIELFAKDRRSAPSSHPHPPASVDQGSLLINANQGPAGWQEATLEPVGGKHAVEMRGAHAARNQPKTLKWGCHGWIPVSRCAPFPHASESRPQLGRHH